MIPLKMKICSPGLGFRKAEAPTPSDVRKELVLRRGSRDGRGTSAGRLRQAPHKAGIRESYFPLFSSCPLKHYWKSLNRYFKNVLLDGPEHEKQHAKKKSTFGGPAPAETMKRPLWQRRRGKELLWKQGCVCTEGWPCSTFPAVPPFVGRL